MPSFFIRYVQPRPSSSFLIQPTAPFVADTFCSPSQATVSQFGCVVFELLAISVTSSTTDKDQRRRGVIAVCGDVGGKLERFVFDLLVKHALKDLIFSCFLLLSARPVRKTQDANRNSQANVQQQCGHGNL